MAVISMKQLLEAGVHFGHQTRRWNPKMAPYIFTERNGIYIIDLQKTVRKVDEAYNFIRDVAMEGKTVLSVGTKSAFGKFRMSHCEHWASPMSLDKTRVIFSSGEREIRHCSTES